MSTPITSSAPTTNSADKIGGSSSDVQRNTGGALGKDDFLKLMVAQMSQMDPLAEGGSDPSKSVDTMTQFSILEQLTNLASSTTQLGVQTANQTSVSLIGKTVTYSNELGEPVTGPVDSVQTAGGKTSLTVGGIAGIDPGKVLEVK